MGNWYRQVLISTALVQLEGTISRLHQGAVVADVGCGSGIQVSGRGESQPPPTRLASGPGSVAPEGGCGPMGQEVRGDGRRRGESDQISGRAGIPVGTVHEYPTSGPSCAPPTRAFTTEIASTGPATSRRRVGRNLATTATSSGRASHCVRRPSRSTSGNVAGWRSAQGTCLWRPSTAAPT